PSSKPRGLMIIWQFLWICRPGFCIIPFWESIVLENLWNRMTSWHFSIPKSDLHITSDLTLNGMAHWQKEAGSPTGMIIPKVLRIFDLRQRSCTIWKPDTGSILRLTDFRR